MSVSLPRVVGFLPLCPPHCHLGPPLRLGDTLKTFIDVYEVTSNINKFHWWPPWLHTNLDLLFRCLCRSILDTRHKLRVRLIGLLHSGISFGCRLSMLQRRWNNGFLTITFNNARLRVYKTSYSAVLRDRLPIQLLVTLSSSVTILVLLEHICFVCIRPHINDFMSLPPSAKDHFHSFTEASLERYALEQSKLVTKRQVRKVDENQMGL